MGRGSTLLERLHATGYLNKTEEEILDAASKLIESEFYDYFVEAEAELQTTVITSNSSAGAQAAALAREFPVSYKITATVVHVTIFLLGLLGNGILLAAACRSKSLHTPTYYYLVSLACADLLVIITAIPEALIGHHVGKQWLLGSVECAVFIFLNFMGINAGSVSIFTFTVERYIAVCHPLLAYRVCTLRRTKTIILFSWIMVVGYCCPWLMLTEVRPDVNFPERKQCHFRMARHYYQPFFIADLTFLRPTLLTALVAYIKIALVIRQRRATPTRKSPASSSHALEEVVAAAAAVQLDAESVNSVSKSNSTGRLIKAKMSGQEDFRAMRRQGSAPAVPKMLVVVVILFAISWLPFRLILVYNSFMAEAWLNMWFLFFAKTLIYLNCAINPILYNIMSHRFRFAVRKALCCQTTAEDSTKDISRRTSFCRPLAPSASLQWIQLHMATPIRNPRPLTTSRSRQLVRLRAQSRYRSPWTSTLSRQASLSHSVSNNSSFRSVATSEPGNRAASVASCSAGAGHLFSHPAGMNTIPSRSYSKRMRYIDSESLGSSHLANSRGFIY
ncbi:LOW QUALITY PROTEIN: thyrotropin-releasing hormone receptor-like [Paramacrobiotus metropolitanus]|uniref:LOW QUALITY PROTEIN: thyrotropin-releasing hormone receptor-like n=1 Tax=Paramacrobiotus metropolitanus TaxID=2943436 RepID=UPI002445B593|nr:LOW QUALITY PROTEIN: thyrotropin-releasing hormone receptor-like [Paramacrobiotus metropolitanus]